jgi:hypothetical protein
LGYLASGRCTMSHSEKNKSGELHLFPSSGERMERHLIRFVQLLDRWRSFSNLPLFHVKWDRSISQNLFWIHDYGQVQKPHKPKCHVKASDLFNSYTLCEWKNRGPQSGLVTWMPDLTKSDKWLQICIQYSESV